MATKTGPQDRKWCLDDITYRGLEWGPASGTPVLALHGWMDHADSFRELAPRLTGCHVVALDLSGQGLSDHRAAHATYNIWDDLPQIAALLDELGWTDCVLMGHSRGANISTLFAAAQPERVRALVAIDALVPNPQPDEKFVETLRAFIEQTRARKSGKPRTFSTKADYISRRQKQGNSQHTSEALADRALAEVQDGVQMRGDPRMFASSSVRLTQKQIENVLGAIRCPVLNIWASGGILKTIPGIFNMPEVAKTLVADYRCIELEGDHHFHLDPVIADRMADVILSFLANPSG